MADDGRILQIITDGNRHPPRHIQLPAGYEANFITLEWMRRIVAHDAQLGDLRNFAYWGILGGIENLSRRDRLDKAFAFCRDTIRYKLEDEGYETVADLWSTCFALNFQGDCVLKSVALATLLCYLNLKPEFVALRQLPPTVNMLDSKYPFERTSDYFNHVYVKTIFEGKELRLDPTPPEFRPGDKVTGYVEYNYKIFA